MALIILNTAPPIGVINFLCCTALVGLFLSSRHVLQILAEMATEGSEESAQQNYQKIMAMTELKNSFSILQQDVECLKGRPRSSSRSCRGSKSSDDSSDNCCSAWRGRKRSYTSRSRTRRWASRMLKGTDVPLAAVTLPDTES